jgi:voltage-gated potassium channel
MSKPAYEELAPSTRRLLVLRVAARALASTAVLVAVYYLVPLKRVSDVPTLGVISLAFLLVLAVLVLQVRSIVRSDYPRLRAIEAVFVAVPVYLLSFAAIYYLMASASSDNFGEALTRTDALYFSVTVFATVGFGDIVATSEAGRVFVTTQMVGDLVLIGFGLRVLLTATQVGLERRPAAGAAPDAGASNLSREPEPARAEDRARPDH